MKLEGKNSLTALLRTLVLWPFAPMQSVVEFSSIYMFASLPSIIA